MAFPNVPNVPGVPPLLRNPNVVSAAVSLLARDVVSFLTSGFAAQWGVFKDGLPVVIADSVVSVGYKQDWAIADFPIEDGAFETYDKVETPFTTRVRFASGGSTADRQALIQSIDAIAGDLELYDVVTPEVVYRNVNIQNYSYHRDARNVGLLMIDVTLLEVRVTATAAFSNTKTAGAQGPVNGGTVNPVPRVQSITPVL